MNPPAHTPSHQPAVPRPPALPLSDKQLDLEEALLKMEKKQSKGHNDTLSTCSGHTR